MARFQTILSILPSQLVSTLSTVFQMPFIVVDLLDNETLRRWKWICPRAGCCWNDCPWLPQGRIIAGKRVLVLSVGRIGERGWIKCLYFYFRRLCDRAGSFCLPFLGSYESFSWLCQAIQRPHWLWQALEWNIQSKPSTTKLEPKFIKMRKQVVTSGCT